MKFNLIFAVFLCFLIGGCSSNPKKDEQAKLREKRFTKSGVCPMRSDEDKLRRQTAKQMSESRRIPSVDFEFDSIILELSAYDTLDKLAEIMVTNRKFKLIVEGHTDGVGTDEYNDWLSKSRANAIRAYLVSRGVFTDSITTYGMGKRLPLVNDDSPEGRACNRRVNFILTTREWNAIF